MAIGKNRLILLGVLACVGGGLAMVSRSQSTAVGADSIPGLKVNSSSGNQGGEIDPVMSSDMPSLFYKLMVAVLFVAALGVGAVYVSKKFLPRFTNLPGKEIGVLETVYIGNRRALHLIRINQRKLLIGSTNEQITKLADVTDAGADEELEPAETAGY